MTPYTYYEYYAWYMKPDGGFDSNNRVGYLSYGKQSPYTLNANAAWHVDPGGNVTVDFDFVSYSYGIIMVGFWIEIIIFSSRKYWWLRSPSTYYHDDGSAWKVWSNGYVSYSGNYVDLSYGHILSGNCYKSRCIYRYNNGRRWSCW